MAVIKTDAELLELLAEVEQQPRVVIDTETTGLDPWKHDRLCGIGLAWHEGEDLKSYYVPYRHRDGTKDSEHELVSENLGMYTIEGVWKALSMTKVSYKEVNIVYRGLLILTVSVLLGLFLWGSGNAESESQKDYGLWNMTLASWYGEKECARVNPSLLMAKSGHIG